MSVNATLSPVELRALYLLRKLGNHAKRGAISQEMHRTPREEREAALVRLEGYGLVASADVPPKRGQGGTGGTVYWLTDLGLEHFSYLVDAGEIAEPAR